MLLKIHEENPSLRQIKTVSDCLRSGGVIIYPTDTVYALGCDIYKPKAFEKIAQMKGIKPEKAHFSFVCNDLSQLSGFTRAIPNHIFKLMRRNLPGPFTFILEANNNVPNIFHNRKKTIGIRIPANNIALEVVRVLGNPILSTSLHDEDEILDYITDPELIQEKYKKLVEMVIDGGFGGNEPSTIVDCTGEEPMITRQGKGELQQ